ncbi:hypothetical protein AB0P21_22095 [Kribbella sp. NPDC056861]|uniref:hypothetical protein n=1 Tax=Kribbella sp. NPDC056861 TaxID=3154857 RepID=UPI00343C6DA3
MRAVEVLGVGSDELAVLEVVHAAGYVEVGQGLLDRDQDRRQVLADDFEHERDDPRFGRSCYLFDVPFADIAVVVAGVQAVEDDELPRCESPYRVFRRFGTVDAGENGDCLTLYYDRARG